MGAQQGNGAGRLVGGQVVGDDDLTGFEGGREFVLDVSLKAGAVHRPVQHPRGDQAIVAKARNEGLSVPVAKGRVIDQPRADRGPASGFDEIGHQRGFVNKDQTFQHVGHVRLALLNPDPARLGHVGPQLFAGEQSFFYG